MHSVAPGPAWTPCFAAGTACAARRQLPCFAAGTACKARWLRPQASLLVVGDLGYANSQTLPDLLKEAEGGGFDALLHVGDIAYDLQVAGCLVCWRPWCADVLCNRAPGCVLPVR